jgi:hypothetical protein
LRGETGHGVSDKILKYDGEPFEPRQISEQVKAILKGEARRLDVTEAEAREIASHYLYSHLGEEFRPGELKRLPADGHGEPIWRVEIVNRDSGKKHGEVRIGVETGATYSWQPVS